MAGEAAAALLTIQAIQAAFQTFDSTVKLGSFLCPFDAPIETITSIGRFNYIIVGGGTAGSVLANRLSACPSVTVLLLEAGGCPPLEANFLGLFPFVPGTKYDYDYYSTNDNYSLQNLQGGVGAVTIGKMLGGSSSLHHGLHVRGDKLSYDRWARAANDSSWTYGNLLPYFKRSEKNIDKPIIEQYRNYHGTTGNILVKRQISYENNDILEAYEELGYRIRIDTNNIDPLGVDEPLLQNGNIYRQSGLVSFIYPAKDRPNLFVLTGATVTKILFNDSKVATGVQFTYNGSSYVVNSIDEVIVSAGAIKTPQLLMLSGIGPSNHLKSKNITVVADLPVGENLQDHPSVVMIFTLESDSSPTPALDPTKFPTPLTCNYANLDNKQANFAQCQGINLIVPQNSSGLMAICLNAFKYDIPICQRWYDANNGKKIMFSFNSLYSPLSRGSILLNTTNIDDQPLVNVGYLSNKTDLINIGRCLAQTAKVLTTNYFKTIGAEFVDLGLCSEHEKYSPEYWQCYGLAMSTTSWHFSGTAAMGSVVDSRLLVNGVKGLRVVDASVIPEIPNAKLIAPVLAVAEKAADMIGIDHKYCNIRNANRGNILQATRLPNILSFMMETGRQLFDLSNPFSNRAVPSE